MCFLYSWGGRGARTGCSVLVRLGSCGEGICIWGACGCGCDDSSEGILTTGLEYKGKRKCYWDGCIARSYRLLRVVLSKRKKGLKEAGWEVCPLSIPQAKHRSWMPEHDLIVQVSVHPIRLSAAWYKVTMPASPFRTSHRLDCKA